MDSEDVKKQLAEYRKTHQGSNTETLLTAIQRLAERIDMLQERVVQRDQFCDIPARPVRFQKPRNVMQRLR